MSDDTFTQLSKANLAHLATFKDSMQATQTASNLIDSALKGAKIEASQEALQRETEDNSAIGIQIRTKKLENKKEVKTEKAKQVQESVLVRKEDADALADGFSQRQGNREYRLDPHMLSELAQDLGLGIHEQSAPEEMIAYIRQRMMSVDGKAPDVAMIDKVFEFLIEVMRAQVAAESDAFIKERLKKILNLLESSKIKHFSAHADKIQMTEKIIGAVDAVVETTQQTITETLEHYRDIVHNPPDLQTLRKFYQVKGYKMMMLELKGLNNYLGGNLKRTNLEGPELAQLRSTVVKMQSLIGIFRQSKAQMPTMESYLNLNNIF